MKSTFTYSGRLVGLAILFICAAAHPNELATADEPVVEKPRMLMVTQSKGWRHQSVFRDGQVMSPAEKAMKKLATTSGLFDVDFSLDAATHVTKENLQKYDLVTFYTSGDLPITPENLKYLLGDWMKQKGHGFLAFHSASDTFKNTELYWDFVGGTFDGHPWTSNTKVTFKIHEPEHPSMKPFGKEFELTEEIYQYTHWQPEKVRVLMSIDMEKTKLKRPYHVPVAWVKKVGEGHLYYNNLGHRPDTWENEKFLKSIEGAVRWIQGTEAGESTPNPEVSQAEHQLAKKAAEAEGITKESLAAEDRARRARQKANQARREAKEKKKKAEEKAKLEKQKATSDK